VGQNEPESSLYYMLLRKSGSMIRDPRENIIIEEYYNLEDNKKLL
jgi:hypothetical protein